ncbi:MAG: DoxX family membrane protein [Pedobacter sp.]|nr:MAG: DoxX family membrane protein [Pedobacter sp.]
MKAYKSTSIFQKVARVALGLFMVAAGVGHLTFQRKGFQAQVPNWVPATKDFTVVSSGYVEIALGLALIFWKKERIPMGIFLGLFYVMVFPGNLAQYNHHRSSLGLDTDQKRLTRLFFQPVLIFWALWSTGALTHIKNKLT